VPLIYKDLSYKTRGCVYEVFSQLGPGWDESIYHNALDFELKSAGLNAQPHYPIPVAYRNQLLVKFETDFVVDEKIILELKAVHNGFLPVHYAQIIAYLKAYQSRLGLLINFGLHKAEIERVPFSEKTGVLTSNFQKIHPLSKAQQALLQQIQHGCQNILNALGPGSLTTVYERAMRVELNHQKLLVTQKPIVGVKFKKHFVGNNEIEPWLIDEQLLLNISTGISEIPVYKMAYLRSYLKQMQLKLGVICHFNKTGVILHALSP